MMITIDDESDKNTRPFQTTRYGLSIVCFPFWEVGTREVGRE